MATPNSKFSVGATSAGAEQAREVRAGLPTRRGGAKRIAARATFARALWTRDGQRRLPGRDELDRALSNLTVDDFAWLCEFGPLGPLYFLPTRPFVNALARELRKLGVTRVLEVGAGDGFLSRCLRAAAPDVQVMATDSGAWQRPEGRMSAAERRELQGTAVPGLALGADVERLAALPAIEKYKPELVLAAWLPPGPLLDRLIRAEVAYVLELGAPAGVTPSAWSWRFAHEFIEGPVEQLARCRLDVRPRTHLHSRATLYFGAAHLEHDEARVRPGDWLDQFRPRRSRSSPAAPQSSAQGEQQKRSRRGPKGP